MPDEFFHNGLADQNQSGEAAAFADEPQALRKWWNGLGDMWRSYGPAGSVAMQERGPWMRDALPKDAADFAANALTYGPMGLAARGGVGSAALEHQTPNPAVMARMQRGLHGAAENDAGTILSAVQPVRHPDYAYTYGDRGPANMNPKGAPRDMLLGDRLDLAPGVRSTTDILRDMRVSPDRIGGEVANSNPPLRDGSGELASRPGVRSVEDIHASYDPTFRGAVSGNFYRGPNTPANDHPPGPYDPSYNRSLMMQRKAEEDAYINALLQKSPTPPQDPFKP